MRALVIGDDTRSFLAIVRSLGRDGWMVDAAPFDFSSPALSSRYLNDVHRIDPYPLGAERWLTRLTSLIDRHRYDLIIPCDDRALMPLACHAEVLAPTRLALPNPTSIDTYFDKIATRRLAMSLGVAVARAARSSVPIPRSVWSTMSACRSCSSLVRPMSRGRRV